MYLPIKEHILTHIKTYHFKWHD